MTEATAAGGPAVVGVVFSKDRPLQLDATLRSFRLQCRDADAVTLKVLYTTSGAAEQAHYDALRAEHPRVEFVRESDFATDLRCMIAQSEQILLLVDDALFVREFTLRQLSAALAAQPRALGFSLRLGRNTTYCYPFDAAQRLPEFDEVDHRVLRFNWTRGDHDFGYPLEVSSSVYRRAQLQACLESALFKNPNQLEASLASSQERFSGTHPELLCFEQSVAFCNPANVVQELFANRFAADPHCSAESLQRLFALGLRIDVGRLSGFTPTGCHQEVPFAFEPPATAWEQIEARLMLTMRQTDSQPVTTIFDGTLEKARVGSAELGPLLALLRMLSQLDPARDQEPWLAKLGRLIEEDRLQALRGAEKTIAGLKRRLTVAQAAAAALCAEKAARRLAGRGRAIRLLRGVLLVAGSFLGGRRGWTRLRQLWLGVRIAFDREALATWRRHFDPLGYFARNPDLLLAGPPASLHYLLRGYLEGREVSPGAGSRQYLRENPDVAQAGDNPLAHYALFGSREGRVWAAPEETEPSAAGCNASRQPDAAPPEIRQNTVWPDELPLVTVVIPCFNYGGHLREALETVLRQTWEDLEVIVVEGGSTQAGSLEAVRRLEAEAPSRTRFLYRHERHLAGDNRNFGIGQARGRYVCCLDADDLLEPVYLEVALFLAERFGYDLVYPSVRCFGESELVFLIREARFPEIARENALSTVALFKRSAWAEVGGYRDWGLGDRHVPEDWEFWVRVLGHGYRATGIRAPLMNYRVHARSLIHSSTSSARFQAEQIFEANRPLIERGHPARAAAPRVEVLDGFTNILAPQRVPGSTNAVLFALPFITGGEPEQLLATLGKDLVDRGWRLIVTTSTEPPKSTPSTPELFRQVTAHVYDLANLFADDEQRAEFVRFLLERYQVCTLLLAGCRFVSNLLPLLQARRPRMAVLDQFFNDLDLRETICGSRKPLDLTLEAFEESRKKASPRSGSV